MLYKSCPAGENGLFFLVSSKCSPECHNRISFIFIDESFIVHNDIGHLFKVYAQEMYQFFRLHIFRYTCESGDIGEEARDVHPFPVEFYFLEFIEDIYNEFFREVLRKSSFQGTFSRLLIYVFVSGNKDGCQHNDEHQLYREGKESLK
ncbi:MAG: hypothetical protein ACD_78C00151G0002 [uncultured bacterium (gcode 4)]|uniref:Uncharacterized protein n=1 Tax=uncultured bacterium (gcode 4) TaxID=1234023 RepID=K1XYB2_9BACT|nr:MAG: hypothetical protein ACD_78C00151G0002 [uncultured bacterium (gcode 4)]